ncbi:aldo/keto reductase [Candidatus Aenigmatarchaeota archaeon]
METKEIDEFKIPVLGFGTWQMGGDTKRDTTNDEKDTLAIKTAIELGMIHIDTAELYGDGRAEELVGEAIKGFDRSKLFITTKVKGDNLKYNEVIEAAKNSMKRMGIDYIDLYLIHWPNNDIPLEETMKAMNDLVDNNIVKHIGVSNFSVDQMKEAQKYSKHKIVTNQIQYSLLIRNNGIWNIDMESKIIPYCQKNNIIVTVYRPLDKGDIIKTDSPLMDELSKKYNKSKAQIALNWIISKKNMIALFKASNTEHIKDNLGTLDWKLDQEDIEKLDKGIN